MTQWDIVIAIGILIGIGSTAVTVFVTRYEHRDVLGRLSRLERWQDERERTRG